jgi:pantothenate kinase
MPASTQEDHTDVIRTRDLPTPRTVSEDIPQLVQRALALAASGRRRVLGITGTPGAGKSTITQALLAALGDRAVAVGMDGFHLANAELVRLGRRDRKGAPDTFDVDGYVALLDRLSGQTRGVIYAPLFDRDLEESIGSAVAVAADIPLVITEGNYLLHDQDGWDAVAAHLDEVWYLDVEADERQRRLVARRLSHGHPADEAAAWVRDVDERNAVVVERARERADLVVRVPASSGSAPAASSTPREGDRA